MRSLATAALLTLMLAACASAPAHVALLEVGTAREVSVEQVVQQLAAEEVEVVFVGELHMGDEAHALIADLARALDDRLGPIAISMEMFERDVQDVVDDYVGGRIDEAAFLAQARPWNNYSDHYAPLVRLAAERDLDLLAANAPQSLVSRVGTEGIEANDSLFAAQEVDLADGPYKQRFIGIMRGLSQAADSDHAGDDAGVERMWAAQVLRDETMAETLARYLEEPEIGLPVLQLNGRFHSDYGLGTVERLLRRRPGTRIALISMAEGREARDKALDPERPARWIIRSP